jgi:RNA polymerase I-specific transcription initiation factor RRN6
MHWVPAADPTTYDWAATTRAVDEEFGITQESEDLSQKEREKLKRKAERLLKRQKRELNLERRNAESQPVLALRSSPPPIVGLGMSSQTQPARQSQADSQGFPPFGFGVVQSQVELGRHGGRPAIKKKKKAKGRISGF